MDPSGGLGACGQAGLKEIAGEDSSQGRVAYAARKFLQTAGAGDFAQGRENIGRTCEQTLKAISGIETHSPKTYVNHVNEKDFLFVSMVHKVSERRRRKATLF